mgnify:CR=1 FL=1
MGAVIGELLPLAVGIAISPIPMAMVIFTLVAASTVAVPVLGHLAARDRMAAPLDRLPAWLTQHNTAAMMKWKPSGKNEANTPAATPAATACGVAFSRRMRFEKYCTERENERRGHR